MALVEQPVLRQTISAQERSNSIRVNNGMVILDVGSGSSCTVDVKMMNGTWIPLSSADGTAYAYSADAAFKLEGDGKEFSVNVGTYSTAVTIEIHAGH